MRLFLALVSSAQSINELEPLPNIDFNILAGNSLIGLCMDEKEYNKLKPPQAHLFQQSYPQIIAERLRNLAAYRNVSSLKIENLRELKDNLEEGREKALPTLNQMLTDEFGKLGVSSMKRARGMSARAKKEKPKTSG
ncbi:MAG: hypothetical protein R2865_16565 [Deinococcales bacterium]